MKRWAFNLFCLFSLLVFVSSVALWVRSYLWADGFSYLWLEAEKQAEDDWLSPKPRVYEIKWLVLSDRGTLHVIRTKQWPPSKQTQQGFARHRYESRTHDPADLRFLGFQWRDKIVEGNVGSYSTKRLGLPLWLFLPAAVPPILWWRKWRKSGGRGFPVSVAAASDPSRDREVREDAKTAAKG